jgi:hypothetical protein
MEGSTWNIEFVWPEKIDDGTIIATNRIEAKVGPEDTATVDELAVRTIPGVEAYKPWIQFDAAEPPERLKGSWVVRMDLYDGITIYMMPPRMSRRVANEIFARLYPA